MSAIYYWDNLFVRLSDIMAVKKTGDQTLQIWLRSKSEPFTCVSANPKDCDNDFEKLKQGVVNNPVELLQWQT